MENKKEKPKLFTKDYQKQWSETYKYKHIHTGEYCTFEAYVAEYIVLRRAEKLNLGKPSYKFWTKGDPNHWLWTKQLCAARILKKKYSEEAILTAIKSKEFEKLLVLGIQNGRGFKINPAAEKVIAFYHKKLLSITPIVEQQPIPESSEDKTVRKTQSYDKKKIGINQLRNI